MLKRPPVLKVLHKLSTARYSSLRLCRALVLIWSLCLASGYAQPQLSTEIISEAAVMTNDFLLQEYLGDVYYLDNNPDYKRALYWYELAAPQSAYAAAQASKIYRLGEAGDTDCEQALRYASLQQRLSRGDTSSDNAVNMVAWVYATCADPVFRDGALALKRLEKHFNVAKFLTLPPYILDTVAAAYAAAGDFDKAIFYQQKTIERIKQDTDERKEYIQHLDMYRRHKPWVEHHTVLSEFNLLLRPSKEQRQIVLLRKKRKVAESYFAEANDEVIDIYLRLAKLYLDQNNYYLAAAYASRARSNGVSVDELKEAGIQLTP